MEKLHTSNAYWNNKDVSIFRDLARQISPMVDIGMVTKSFKDAYNITLDELLEVSKRVLESYGYYLDNMRGGHYYITDMRTGKKVDFKNPKSILRYSDNQIKEFHISDYVAIYFVSEFLDIEVDLKQ